MHNCPLNQPRNTEPMKYKFMHIATILLMLTIFISGIAYCMGNRLDRRYVIDKIKFITRVGVVVAAILIIY